jgi:hypothetical protein
MMSDQKPQPVKTFFDTGWAKIIMGLVAVAGAYYFNETLLQLDTGAIDSVRVHWMIAILYNTLGRIPTILFLGAFALLLIGMGIRQLVMERTQ